MRGLTVRTALAAIPLAAMACGSPEGGTAPSAVPRTYLLGTHDTGVRLFDLGQDGRLTAASLGDVILPVTQTPTGPFVDPERRLVYLFDAGGGFLNAYRIDSSTGALILWGRAEVPLDKARAVVDPSGRFLYAVSGLSALGFRIDTQAGLALLPLPMSPITAPEEDGYPRLGSFEFSPSGRFVWLNGKQRTGPWGYPRTSRELLLSFRVLDTGELEPTGSRHVGVWDGDRSNLVTTPGEQFAFLGRRESLGVDPGVTRYRVDPVSGTLTEEGNLRGTYCGFLHVTPSGRWLLAGPDQLQVFENQAEGLVHRHTVDLPVAEGPRPLVQHGAYVYVNTSWRTSEGYTLGTRLAVLRFDEGSGALAPIQELQVPGVRLASLAIASLTP
ncbi:MAG TPA: hypothetical protein VJU18_09660 [Vicinamibacteria bacterium]|nr:hypothetical protein [Vicinamibacteria bacterium]